jgi:hypothetical protein
MDTFQNRILALLLLLLLQSQSEEEEEKKHPNFMMEDDGRWSVLPEYGGL